MNSNRGRDALVVAAPRAVGRLQLNRPGHVKRVFNLQGLQIMLLQVKPIFNRPLGCVGVRSWQGQANAEGPVFRSIVIEAPARVCHAYGPANLTLVSTRSTSDTSNTSETSGTSSNIHLYRQCFVVVS